MVVAYRRGRNLKDYLVHSRLSKPNEKKRKRTVKKYVRGANGRVFELPQIVPLNRPNCIYLISCKKCGKRYVGETKNTILVRMAAHRYTIRKGVTGKGHIVPHFVGHGVENIRVRGLEHNPNWGRANRWAKERQWIKKLGTLFPRGLNERI